MNWFFKVIIIFFLNIQLIHANNKVGNGGDGVFCVSPEGQPLNGTLLDFYESKQPLPPDIGVNDSYILIAENILKKIKKAAPKISEQYSIRLKNIESEFEFIKTEKLVDISDSMNFLSPGNSNCQILQIIIRKKFVTKNESRFLVQENLWNRLDNINKAGLILHEIIYEHFSKLGQENSVKARRLNSFMFFNSNITENSFWSLVKQFEIALYP